MSKRILLEGKNFGKLHVDEYIGNRMYKCTCECGKKVLVYASNLTSNHTTSCGCAKVQYDIIDLTFGYLKVIGPADGKVRGNYKRRMVKCWCLRCGTEKDIYVDALLDGATYSCGCLSRERELPEELIADFVEGTQLSKLGGKITAANKSGVAGVNWDKSRKKWMAGIRFKGRRYNLGRFENFEDAVKARKEAESKIHGEFIQWYNDYRKQTDLGSKTEDKKDIIEEGKT